MACDVFSMVVAAASVAHARISSGVAGGSSLAIAWKALSALERPLPLFDPAAVCQALSNPGLVGGDATEGDFGFLPARGRGRVFCAAEACAPTVQDPFMQSRVEQLEDQVGDLSEEVGLLSSNLASWKVERRADIASRAARS